jgi:hypothetical protein
MTSARLSRRLISTSVVSALAAHSAVIRRKEPAEMGHAKKSLSTSEARL